MAVDRELAERVRAALAVPDLDARNMFGGTCAVRPGLTGFNGGLTDR